LQRHVRQVVVPSEEEVTLAPEGRKPQRHDGKHPKTAALESADEPFRHSDAAVLTDGASTLTDATTATPVREAGTGELDAAVGDEVLGDRGDARHDAAEELADLLRGRLLSEDGEAKGTPRKVIDDDGAHPRRRGVHPSIVFNTRALSSSTANAGELSGPPGALVFMNNSGGTPGTYTCCPNRKAWCRRPSPSSSPGSPRPRSGT
jgi:hypothetical protein